MKKVINLFLMFIVASFSHNFVVYEAARQLANCGQWPMGTDKANLFL